MNKLLLTLLLALISTNAMAGNVDVTKQIPKTKTASHPNIIDKRGTNEFPLVVKTIPPEDEKEKTKALEIREAVKSKRKINRVSLH